MKKVLLALSIVAVMGLSSVALAAAPGCCTNNGPCCTQGAGCCNGGGGSK